MKKLILLSIIILAVGCASISELEQKAFSNTIDGQFVPVSVLIDDGTNGSGNAVDYDARIYEHIQASNLFKHLGASPSSNVSIFAKYNSSSNGSAAGDTTKLLVSAATLFLVPTRVDWNYELVVMVRVNDDSKEYRYHDRVKRSVSIADSNGGQETEIMKNLMNHFLAEIQEDNFIPKVKSL